MIPFVFNATNLTGLYDYTLASVAIQVVAGLNWNVTLNLEGIKDNSIN